MNFIEVPNEYGYRIAINCDKIEQFEEKDDGTLIIFTNSNVFTTLSYSKIVNLVPQIIKRN